MDLPDHLQVLHDALWAEQRAEADEMARLDALSIDEQVALGHRWPLLTLADRAIEGQNLRFVAQGPMLHDGIGPGETVWLHQGRNKVPGRIEDVDPRTAEIVADRRAAEGLERGAIGISRRHDPSTHVRYRQALERAATHRSDLTRALAERGPTPLGEGTTAIEGLNPAQQRAAYVALRSPDLALVWGPPGTGKTRLLAQVLKALVGEGDRPWALADSNAAVDHLTRAALALGLDVVRLGPVHRIDPALSKSRLDHKIRESLLGKAIATLDKEIMRAAGTPAEGRLLNDRRALWEQARDEVLAKAQVIATTFGTLARLAPTLPTPVTAVVDEATQAMAPAIWVAVPFVSRLVLAGDPEQLGPVVKSVGGAVLRTSLLAQWVQRGAQAPMLEVQHRMSRTLRLLVHDVYGDQYTDDATVAEQPPVWGEKAVQFIDTAGVGAEARDPLTHSLYNDVEVALAGHAVAELRSAGLRPDEIGVITPYSAQVARIGEHPAMAGVEVATVNAFQGREKEAIVVSFVRTNPERELGFVADPRRLTVSLTRARRQLILIGDAATLGVHPRFAALIAGLEADRSVASVWDPDWAFAVE